ncbi:type II secretion system protein N [Rhodoferax sp. OV413]|uniref:type II secretion system protein N n=1 Tax=Rhodoferax sp. OV413 TaxID=1855285 RepID=UPI0025D77DA2|nr:type II secretion system protein N [Rhodoferax sp. OV413]
MHSRHMKPRRSRTPWIWACAGAAAGLLVAALVFAPARWLAHGLAGSLHGFRDGSTSAPHAALTLHKAQGTLWDGSAQLMLGSSALPSRLEWTLRPQWQADGPGLVVSWTASCCLRQPWRWDLVTDGRSARMRTSDLPATEPLRLPADLLSGLGVPWNTLQPQGQIEFSSRQLGATVGAEGVVMQGFAQLDVLGLSTSLSTLRPVGSYRLGLQGTPVTLTMSTLEGALRLQGQGSLQDGRFVFDGEASAAEGLEDALSNLLNIIGQRQGARSLIHLG